MTIGSEEFLSDMVAADIELANRSITLSMASTADAEASSEESYH